MLLLGCSYCVPIVIICLLMYVCCWWFPYSCVIIPIQHIVFHISVDSQEATGWCDYILYICSIFIIVITTPFSLVFCIKVRLTTSLVSSSSSCSIYFTIIIIDFSHWSFYVKVVEKIIIIIVISCNSSGNNNNNPLVSLPPTSSPPPSVVAATPSLITYTGVLTHTCLSPLIFQNRIHLKNTVIESIIDILVQI